MHYRQEWFRFNFSDGKKQNLNGLDEFSFYWCDLMKDLKSESIQLIITWWFALGVGRIELQQKNAHLLSKWQTKFTKISEN